MFCVQNPSQLDKPWILSKKGDIEVSIPIEVTQILQNYHILAIDFLYHNFRKEIKGSILNQEPGMNFPLQISAFLRAVTDRDGIILVICSRESEVFWLYHLKSHGNFRVVQTTTKNSKDTYENSNEQTALLLREDNLNLSQDFIDLNFSCVIIENLDQLANKRAVKRLEGKFNIGLTCRSFYIRPDQTLQWNMLNWVNPGCVGKLHEFYDIDNQSFEEFEDNYRYWWLRLTWDFCDSFQKPSEIENKIYEDMVMDWASEHFPNVLTSTSKRKKRKHQEESETSDNSDTTIINDVPIDKYVKLPSMDESPILTSIIRNFEISPEPILTRSNESFSHALLQPNCSKYSDSILLSFMDNQQRPCTSKSESEEFIINLIKSPESDETNKQDIQDILKKADAVLQN